MPDEGEYGGKNRKRRQPKEEIERDIRVGQALWHLRIASESDLVEDTRFNRQKVHRSLDLNIKFGRVHWVRPEDDPATGGGYRLTEKGEKWISSIITPPSPTTPPAATTSTTSTSITPAAIKSETSHVAQRETPPVAEPLKRPLPEPPPADLRRPKQKAIPKGPARIETRKSFDGGFLADIEARIANQGLRLIDERCDTFVDHKETLLARGPPADEEEDLIYRAAEMLGRLMENAHLGFWYFKADSRTLKGLLDQTLGVAMKSNPTKPYILNVRDFTLNPPRDILFLNAAGFARGAIEILADMGLRPEGVWEERLNKIAAALNQKQRLSYIAYPYNEFMTIVMNPRGPRAYFVPLTARMEDDQRVFRIKSRPVGLLKKMIEPVRFQLPYQDKTVKFS